MSSEAGKLIINQLNSQFFFCVTTLRDKAENITERKVLDLIIHPFINSFIVIIFTFFLTNGDLLLFVFFKCFLKDLVQHYTYV